MNYVSFIVTVLFKYAQRDHFKCLHPVFDVCIAAVTDFCSNNPLQVYRVTFSLSNNQTSPQTLWDTASEDVMTKEF